MVEVVNLRMARKRKARDAQQKTAEQNRLAHGISKADRELARTKRERESAALAEHRRERPAKDEER